MIFVSAISVASALGIAATLKHIPMPPGISLKQRLAPFANRQIGWTLLTTLLVQCGNFIVYTYFAVIFAGASHGDPLILSLLLVLWGVSSTVMNLIGGRLIDSIGARKVLVGVLLALIALTATLSWLSAAIATAIVAVIIHGATSWGQLVPQQHRLVSIMPKATPIVLGLSTSASYIGVASAGVIGAASLTFVGAHSLGWVGLVLYVGALIAAEVTHRVLATPKCEGTMLGLATT
jgi:predicted MFS family arabinose efflux permease